MLMSNKEKGYHMLMWWEENLKLYSTMKLREEDFMNLVLESRLLFRNGISELMEIS